MNELSGYGEVKLGDKTLPFKFGANADYLLCKHRNIELNELSKALADPFALIELSYFAYVTAMRIKDKPTDVGMDEFFDLVGDNKDILPEFEKIIMSSKMWGFTVAELADTKKNI